MSKFQMPTLNLEDKLKAEGFSRVGRAIIKDVSIIMNLSEYWKDRISPDLKDCEIRFVHHDYLPKQPILETNELYVYARIRPLTY